MTFFYVIGASLLVSPADVMNHPFLLYKIDTKQIHYFLRTHPPIVLHQPRILFGPAGPLPEVQIL